MNIEDELPDLSLRVLKEGEGTILPSGNFESAARNYGVTIARLPEGIKYVEYDFIFSGIKKIYLPRSVRSIPSWSFRYCPYLKEIHIQCDDPSLIKVELDSFSETPIEECLLYVPIGASEKYVNHRVFSKFKSIEEEEYDESVFSPKIQDFYTKENDVNIFVRNYLSECYICKLDENILKNSCLFVPCDSYENYTNHPSLKIFNKIKKY